jgi:hypothetical protein
MGVVTAVAIGGLALSAASTAMSFANAGKEKRKGREAEAAAAAAMAEAKKKLSINYTDELAINKDPYELQREAMLSAGAQAIQAGVESERGAATMAGKVLMAQNEAQAGVTTAMGAEMNDIQKQQIAEQSRLRDLGVQLDLGEVEGQQMIAANAEQAATAATQQGIQGIVSTAQQGLNMMPLYFKDKTATATPAENSLGSSTFRPMQNVNSNFTKPFGLNAQQFGPGGALANNQPNFNLQTPSLFPQYDVFGNLIKK